MFAELQEAGVIGSVDRHLAAWLERRGAPEVVQLAGAMASAATRAGHVCVDLQGLQGPVVGDDGERVGELQWPHFGELDHPLVAPQGAPLVQEGSRVYLQRYHAHELALAEALRARAEEVPVDGSRLEATLQRCFAPGDPRDVDQRQAVRVAATRRLAVISGGPGTGKTTTVARLLAVLTDQRTARGLPTRVRLLAPTGKAASRMVEALRSEAAKLPAGLQLGTLPEAYTVHRALSPVRGSRTRYRRGLASPLPEEVVVVDEASMVDLAMMRRLVDAVRPDAHLVLLGDRHQLASVESGAVLGEVARAAELSPEHPLARCVVTLRHSFRFEGGGPIGRLADAVRRGDVAAAVELLDAGGAVRWMPRPPAHQLGAVEPLVRDGFGPLCTAAGADEAVQALGAFRVLCAHRRGPWGVSGLNGVVERSLAAAGCLAPGPGFYRRQPVLVTANDYRLGLFNGDQGVVVADASGLRVAFPDRDGVRLVAPSRLAEVQTVYALSVHKSQGSEFDRVAVWLPDDSSPLLTRELLYTAVTRAKQQVVVVGDRAALARAISTPVQRMSGLAARLVA